MSQRAAGNGCCHFLLRKQMKITRCKRAGAGGGMSGPEVKNLHGSKRKTYHWDIEFDENGMLREHGSDNSHGALPHLQIHDEKGRIIRIFFERTTN